MRSVNQLLSTGSTVRPIVHLRVAHAAVPGRAVDLLEDETRLENTDTKPTVFFGDQRREPAAFGKRIDEFLRVAKLAVEFLPTLTW